MNTIRLLLPPIRRLLPVATLLAALPLFAACPVGATDDGPDASQHQLPDGGSNQNDNANQNANTNQNGNWQAPTNSRVYVNTQDELFYIDPGVSEELVSIGAFSGTCTQGSGFYDIAVNEGGQIIGIAAEGLFQVDSATAECTGVLQFPTDAPHFFSLSFVKGVDPEEPSADRLIAASVEEGEWVLIDWPGEHFQDLFVSLGWYDYPDLEWLSSGDIVSIQTDWTEYHTYATLKCGNYTDPGCESDWLAEIDPQNGNARLIGATGYQRIFGLGFWGDKLYGFTGDGEYIHIDVDTGAGTLVTEFTGRTFWGAGNTTIPHVVE